MMEHRRLIFWTLMIGSCIAVWVFFIALLCVWVQQ